MKKVYEMSSDCPFRDDICSKTCALYIIDFDGFTGCSFKLVAESLARLEEKYGIPHK
jgi:hypothetical protein